jgi:hypothetical protein
MRRAVNAILWLIGLFMLLVGYFVVPIGRYTLFEHTQRIAATEPAQELGADLERTGEQLKEDAIEHWNTRAERGREDGAPDQTAP